MKEKKHSKSKLWAELILISWCSIILYILAGNLNQAIRNVIVLVSCYIVVKFLVYTMFNKNKSVKLPIKTELETTTQTNVINDTEIIDIQEHKSQTVIASHVKFEGNLHTEGTANIYGEHTGNIDAKNGQVNLMRGGIVTGNIICKKLVVDGIITGECVADAIEVLSNGVIDGVIEYSSISVVKGGVIKGRINVRNNLTPEMVSGNNRILNTKEKISSQANKQHNHPQIDDLPKLKQQIS
ncbi:bactofilin family protein [Thorsellia anophelis]|uniref:Protein CcmA, bactofilin family n=1 Tax=Thorsellia anophelis DSM 18579 TaxID=1123402 RepID=A0A1I0BWX2_9GAMM|nr:polymer-forming cytoskeletal protein [Thorsellia anophelis]SET11529.1 protein CcmA, bactofilin family [Thorsellia anophelis DSM 18579]